MQSQLADFEDASNELMLADEETVSSKIMSLLVYVFSGLHGECVVLDVLYIICLLCARGILALRLSGQSHPDALRCEQVLCSFDGRSEHLIKVLLLCCTGTVLSR